MTISTYLSIITSNVDGLNAPIKKVWGDWINRKTILIYMLPHKKVTSDLKTHTGWKWRDGERYANEGKQKTKNKKPEVAILTSHKKDFKTDFVSFVTRNKVGHYTMIKGSSKQKDTTIVNIYAPNIGAPKYIKQMSIDI